MKKYSAKFKLLALALVAAVISPLAARADGLVTASGTTVTFDPAVIITPVLVGVVAAVGAAAGIMIVLWGIRKVYRAIKGGS